MPAVGFMVMLLGGISVWAGYLGQSIPKVTRAVLDGKTKTLTKIPLDPDKRQSVGGGSVGTLPPPGVPAAAHRSGLDRWVWTDPSGVKHYYGLDGHPITGSAQL